MLVGNGVRLNSNPLRQLGAPLANVTDRANFMQAGACRNWWTHTGADKRSGVPDGVRHPIAWRMAPWAGGMSARNQVDVTWTVSTPTLAEGRNLTGAATVTWSAPNASAQLIVSAAGAATVTFSGTGSLSGALAAVGAATVTFTVPTPTLGAVVDAIGAAAIAWSATGAVTAKGWLVTDTSPSVDLSPATLAAAVWAEVLESGLDAADVMRLLLAVAAGKTDIVGTTVTFRDVDDTKDRVTATMTGSERTTIVLDPS